jgi:hypothetical protein
MFVMLKLNHAFVTSMGRLVGVITRCDVCVYPTLMTVG